MSKCSVTKSLEIVKGSRQDYDRLSRYHYRQEKPGVYTAIFTLTGRFRTAEQLTTAGIIVYTMPTLSLELRNTALGNMLTGLDRTTRAAVINRNIRRIARVIIEPRFRGLGLAVRLVTETMPLMNVPIVESYAVMGQINPFFEKAGMTAYAAPPPQRCARLLEAFSAVGIEPTDLIDAAIVRQKLDDLRCPAADFIEREMKLFLQSYGKRRSMQPGIERTRYILGKLTDRPIYYLWRNPETQLEL